MLVKLESCSSNLPGIGKNDNFDRLHGEEIRNDRETKRHVDYSFDQSETKRPCLESSADQEEYRTSVPSTTRTNVKEAVNYDEPLGFLQGHDFDIFNADDDRQELINYCERMLAECDDQTQQHFSTCLPITTQQPHHRNEDTMRPDSAGESYDTDDSHCSMGPRSSFDKVLRRTTEEPPRLKSAYYFDGQRFVAIQVVMDSGKCQLVLPIDHPHHLGVPEEVPVFETKTVPADDFIKH